MWGVVLWNLYKCFWKGFLPNPPLPSFSPVDIPCSVWALVAKIGRGAGVMLVWWQGWCAGILLWMALLAMKLMNFNLSLQVWESNGTIQFEAHWIVYWLPILWFGVLPYEKFPVFLIMNEHPLLCSTLGPSFQVSGCCVRLFWCLRAVYHYFRVSVLQQYH